MSTRIGLAFLLVLWLLVGSLLAGAAQQPTTGTEENDPHMRAQLDRELPEVTFDGNSLGDVIDFLRDVSGANIYVNWKALADAGVNKDVPITVQLKNVKFKKALDVILEDAGGGTTKLKVAIDGGVISIAASEGARRVTRAYDVSDLLPERAPSVASGPAIVPGLEKPAPGRADEVIKLLSASVAPSTWESNGGSVGSVKEADGKLIVTQTVENHEAVKNWLESLRNVVKNANK